MMATSSKPGPDTSRFVQVGETFSFPGSRIGVQHAKCAGCGCNFVVPTIHVSFSADCDEIRYERIASQTADDYR